MKKLFCFLVIFLATRLGADPALPPDFPADLLAKAPSVAKGKGECTGLPTSLHGAADLVVYTYACAVPATAKNPAFTIEITAHFARDQNGQWTRTGLRALNVFSPAPMAAFPSWADYQTLSPESIATQMAPALKTLWPDLAREDAAHRLYAVLGLKFADSNQLRHWMTAYQTEFSALASALLEQRAKTGKGFAARPNLKTPTSLDRMMLQHGLKSCIVTRAGQLDPSVMAPDTPEIECTYAVQGGDNRAGFLWSSTPDRIPQLRLNRVYFLLDLGGGWFAFKET